jgi:2-succinyl-6-hydroxy-2,4-cyclohexadiene-1-carboxylate synthase
MASTESPLDWRPLAGPLAAEVSGSGDRLIFVHGFTQTGRSWLPVVEPFAADHEIVLVDAPGHGASAMARADLRRGADLLTSTAGAGTYVGYSMGGRLCLHAALAYPHLVKRLVLVGASPGLADDEERMSRRATDEALAEQLERDGLEPFLEQWLAQPIFSTLPESARGLDERRRNAPQALAASLRNAGTGAQLELWSRLWGVRMPVLLVVGELDTKFAAIADDMAAAIGELATIGTIRGVGHAAPWEHPTWFVSLLRSWFEDNPIRL